MKLAIKTIRAIVILIGCVFSISLTGCIAIYASHPVAVSVQDAETGKPISGAKVELRYNYMLVLNPPKPDSKITDTNGIAILKAATFDPQSWNISADGFLPCEKVRYEENKPKKTLVVRLYRGPAPSVTILVPNGYRGPLKIDMRPISTWIQGEVGKRNFTYHASPTGYVEIPASPLLIRTQHNGVGDPRVFYEDGQPIRGEFWGTKNEEVSLRWLEVNRNRELYAIGTKDEANAIDHKVEDSHSNGSTSLNSERFNAFFDKPLPQSVEQFDP